MSYHVLSEEKALAIKLCFLRLEAGRGGFVAVLSLCAVVLDPTTIMTTVSNIDNSQHALFIVMK